MFMMLFILFIMLLFNFNFIKFLMILEVFMMLIFYHIFYMSNISTFNFCLIYVSIMIMEAAMSVFLIFEFWIIKKNYLNQINIFY